MLDYQETPYTITLNSKRHFHAMFRIGGMRYLFEADFNGPEWGIRFSAYNNGQRTQLATNTGNTPLVFATVGRIFDRFIERHRPEKFYFGGTNTRGRNSLYTRLAKRIADTYNYELNTVGQTVVEYHFTRKGR